MNDMTRATTTLRRPAQAACRAGILISIRAAILVGFTAANAGQPLGKTSLDFLESHCVRCHNGEKQEGQFRLDNLSMDFSSPQVAQKWSEVVFRVNAGEMPPQEEPQPTAEQLGDFADVVTARIRDGAAERMAQRGRVQHYRLSRPEYVHTVFDLLGVVFDAEAPGAFNEDPLWHGFDRIGALLSTAPSHIDRYIHAADTVVELASLDEEVPF